MNQNTLIVGANSRRIRLATKPYPPSQTEIARKMVQITGPELGKTILDSERLMRQRLANLESGRSVRLTSEMISALAKSLGCTEAELCMSSGIEEPSKAAEEPPARKIRTHVVSNIAIVAFPEPMAGNPRAIPQYMVNGYQLPGSLSSEVSYVAVTIKSTIPTIGNGEIWFFQTIEATESARLSEVTALFTDEKRTLFVFNVGVDISELSSIHRETPLPKNLTPLGVLVHRELTDPAGILVL